MAEFISNVTSVATTIVGDIDIFILAGAARFVDFDEAFDESLSNTTTTMWIDGTVYCSGYSAILMLGDGIAPSDRISVGESGRVLQVGSLGSAIDMTGAGQSVSNAGMISGTTGVRFTNALFGTIDNRGTIEGAAGAAISCTASNSVAITNAGTLTGFTGVVFDDSYGQVYNDGTIRAVDANGFAIDADQANAGLTVHNGGLIAAPAIAIRGGVSNDVVINSGTIRGDILLGEGSDSFRGKQGVVEGLIYAGGGDDDIASGGGDDEVHGDAGIDILSGGAGDDRLMGGTGADILAFANGDDAFIAGNDEAQPTDGNDDLDGGDGIDTYDARDVSSAITVRLHEQRATGTAIGIDLVQFFENAFGGSGGDSLVGDSGRNVLRGNGGVDALNGLEGNDRLFGGDGNDTLIGNTGRDAMTGGANADIFDFNNVSDSAAGDSNRDVITDFAAGLDDIDLSTLDANTLLGGNQAFSFIGAGAFTNVAGQLRFANSASAQYTTVEGDVNGDSVADFSIGLFGNIVLAAGDFVL